MADAGLSGVLVLIYLDDVLVVGRGRARVREQTAKAAEALRRAGAVVSPKSTLEPVQRLVWLGKDIDLQGGEVRTAGNAWETLFAHWLRLSVGPCRENGCSSSWGGRSGSVARVLGTVRICLVCGLMCSRRPPGCHLPLCVCLSLCAWRA